MTDVLLPLACFTLFGIILIVVATTRLPEEERRWLLLVLAFAFVLRIGAATMFAVIPSTRIFHEDAQGYEYLGMYLASSWRGEVPPITMGETNYGFYYVAGAVYYFFGHARVAAAYFNCIVGVGTAFMVYRLAREFFHVAIARRATLLVCFIPSMILWSSVVIKDTLMTFLIVLSLSSCVRLKQRLTFGSLLGTLLPIVAVWPIRFYIIYFLGLAILMSLFLERGARALTGISKQLLMVGALVALLAMVGLTHNVESGVEWTDLHRINSFRQGMAATADSGFYSNVDISTPSRALMFMPIGILFLLFSPFPWQFTSLRASFALPEMLLWWYLVPSLVTGVRFTIKQIFGRASPVLIFAATLTASYSLVHGNVGSGFRQRAQIFVFLFIFTSLGQYLRRCRRAGLDEQLLLAGNLEAEIAKEKQAAAARAAAKAGTATLTVTGP